MTQPPPAIPAGIVITLRALQPGAVPARAQLDQVIDALADQGEYAARAWNLCGSGAK